MREEMLSMSWGSWPEQDITRKIFETLTTQIFLETSPSYSNITLKGNKIVIISLFY